MPKMHSDRKAYKRIAPNFEALLTDAARERFRAIVAATDADWYTTANAIFWMGLDAWEQARAAALAEDNAAQHTHRNTEARNICAALWWAWHKQREICERKAGLGYTDLYAEQQKEMVSWDAYLMVRRMIHAQEAADDNA